MPTTKHIELPDGTRRFFGRKRPIARAPRLSMKNYTLKSLAPPPAAYGYMEHAQNALHRMNMNDALGDCVEAFVAHAIGVFTCNAGQGVVLTDGQIVGMYEAMGGYVPGDPATDQGTDMGTALSVWQQSGTPTGYNKISGSLAVDATNTEECRQAIYLFENLMLGLELPDAYVNPFPSNNGFTWDVAGLPNPSQGHCIGAFNYASGAGNFGIATWGMTGFMTEAALAEYCSPANGGELYTVLSHETIIRAKAKAPNGFDFTQLLADFQALGG